MRAAIIQAFNPRNLHPKGMISILEGDPKQMGLLHGAYRAGIEKPLVLMPVLDVPSIGSATQGVYLAREEFGIAAGTAPIGVVGRWKKVGEFGKHARKACRAGAAALAQCMGADFIIYGSVAKARDIFPACAMIDAIVAYNARNYGVRPLSEIHPLSRVF